METQDPNLSQENQQKPPEPGPDLSKELKAKIDELNGLRGFATKTKAERDDLEKRLSETSQQLEGFKVSSAAETADLKKKLEELQARDSQSQAELAQLRKSQQVNQLIGAEFPDLMPFQAKGLLRTDLEGDALKKYLTDYQATVQGISKAAKEVTLEGATPTPPSPAGGGESEEILYKQLMRMNPKDPKYAELEERYYALVAQSQKK